MITATAIRFDDLTLGYGRRPAVHHLDGEVAAGSLTAVVGPNGAGKSTLLKGIVGTLRPLAGHIGLSSGPKTRIAYLPLYLFGIFMIRSLVWCVSAIGLAMMFFGILF